MQKESAGLLLFRRSGPAPEVFLVHPGGPFWAHKDLGVWTIPKGRPEPGEDHLTTARREFHEETGFSPGPDLPLTKLAPSPTLPGATEPTRPTHPVPFHPLGTIQQAGGKIVTAFAIEGDCDPALLTSNLCTVEWPPRSGHHLDIPEIDRGAWFTLPAAAEHILPAQQPFLDRLKTLLAQSPAPTP